jgi:folate-binding protein YgfZ
MDDSASPIVAETPLAQSHREAHAPLGTWFGCALPSDFGDWRSEFNFARNRVGLLDKNYRAYLSFTGPDRVRYLNAILTNNIKELAEQHGTVSLLLNPQGRILAEIETYALGEALFCVSYLMIRDRLIEWLDQYIIMDDVTLTDDSSRFGTLALEGPFAVAVAKRAAGVDITSLEALQSVAATVREIPCRLVRRTVGGLASAEFVVPAEYLSPLWKVLLNLAREDGGGPVGYTALNALRLTQGIPWFGYDFGEKQIPHEAGLQHSHISYSKGCYTGQEIVERVRSRGQVNRQRVQLRFSADALPAPDTILTAGGREAGYVTRAAQLPDSSGGIGMGYARKENNTPGTVLEYPGGTATVIARATAAASD